MEAVPFVKKEPLYVTMRSKENDWIEDSLRIKEAKNVAGHNLDPNIRDGLCNNSNATHRIQSPIRKESNYANKQTEETSTTKLEETQYVGICQRFPPSTRNKRMNLEEEKKSEHHVLNMSTIRNYVFESKVEQINGPDKTSNGSHQLQTEGNRSKATEGSFFDCDEERRGAAGTRVRREVNCGVGRLASGSAADGAAGDAGGGGGGEWQGLWQGLTQEDGEVKTDGSDEVERGYTEAKAGHQPHQDNSTNGALVVGEGEDHQNNCSGGDHSRVEAESTSVDAISEQFENLSRENQVRCNCYVESVSTHITYTI